MLSTTSIVIICIAVGFVLLCIFLKIFTTKYIRGDFSKDNEDEEEEECLIDQPMFEDIEDNIKVEKEDQGEEIMGSFQEEIKEHQSNSVDLNIFPSKSHDGEDSDAMKETLLVFEESTSDSFLSSAILTTEIQFNEYTKCIKGTFESIEGLNSQHRNAPHEINFHLKMIPKNKFCMKTRWRHVSQVSSSQRFALSFTMGPVKRDELHEAKLSVKLYGKKANVLARHEFYGELFLNLSNLEENEEPVIYSTPFLTKGVGTDLIHGKSESESEY